MCIGFSDIPIRNDRTFMGKTFRRNEGRRPKWDKRGNQSHKAREFEEERRKHKFNNPLPYPPRDSQYEQES